MRGGEGVGEEAQPRVVAREHHALAPAVAELGRGYEVQGDTSGCSAGVVNIKIRVAFWYMRLILKLNFCFVVNKT